LGLGCSYILPLDVRFHFRSQLDIWRAIVGKVKVDVELETLLARLTQIGEIKNKLPLNQRGWCNRLGLFVQLHIAGGHAKLEAGDDKWHSQIEAWIARGSQLNNQSWTIVEGNSSRIEAWITLGAEWQVKKYRRGDWEKLVEPTYDAAKWLLEHGGLPGIYKDSFDRAIEAFERGGSLQLPMDMEEAGE
jgi:hypothetical protein